MRPISNYLWRLTILDCDSLRSFLVASALLTVVESADALNPERRLSDYSHQSITVEDGLPQATVMSVAQTPDGYLWLATFGGLVRSDGVSFTVFDPGNTDVLSTAMIYALEVAADGTLWVGTGDGLFSVRDGHFERWDRQLGLEHSRVLSLHVGRNQALWIGTYAGLARLQDDKLDQWGREEGLADESIWSIFEDRDGNLWLGTWVGGLIRFKDGRFEARHLADLEKERGYWGIDQDRAGRLWMATGHGLFVMEGEDIKSFSVVDGLVHEHLQAIEIDRDDNIWLGSYSEGLIRVRYDPDQGTLEAEVFNENHGLTSNKIWDLYEDREGHLWAGTLGGGADVFRDGVFVTHGLGKNSVFESTRSVTQDAAGNIWVATLTGGLFRMPGPGEPGSSTRVEGLPTDRLWSVLGSRSGHLWVATSGAGLVRIGEGGQKVFRREDGLPHDIVFGIYEGPDGTLWLTSNGGLGRLQNDRFTTLTTDDGLSSNLVRSVLVDQAGDLWVGTAGSGICRRREDSMSCFGPEHGLTASTVWSLLEDSHGILWLGTSSGLFRWIDGRFRGITAREGLQFDNVSTLVEDDTGNLWLGTRRGVLRIRRRQLTEFYDGRIDRILSLRYGLADGLKSTETVGGVYPAAFKASDGKLWFPTLKGVAVVDPGEVEAGPVGPPSRIESFAVDGEERDLGVEQHQLKPGVRRVELSYTAFSLRAPRLLQFRYRLVGFDGAWVNAGNRRRVAYTNLPAGDYRFLVSSRNEDGEWNPEAAGLSFRIERRFYETTPFLAFCLILGLSTVFGLHRLRVFQLRKHQKLLKEEVEQALAQVKTLSGMLPICSQCKKIREDDGYWSQLESYLSDHSDATFTHGICPPCAERVLHEMALDGVTSRDPRDVLGEQGPAGTPGD